MLKRITALAFFVLMALPFSKVFADANVTFQVHMGIQMQLGAFNPTTDSLVIRGDFGHYVGQGDWGDSHYYFLLKKSSTNDSIYTITIPFPDSVKGKTIQFKYVVVDKGVDAWEGVDNRTASITTETNQSIPLAYYNNRTTLGVTVNITFEADMSDLLTQGFIPGSDMIEVRGDPAFPPLNWGPGVTLNQDLADPTLFKATFSFTGTAGTTITWKFHADPENRFANTGWDDITSNRSFTFPSKDTTIGPIKPVITVGGLITAADTITLRVDMNGAHERFHNLAITGLKSVWVGGSVTPLTWPSAWTFADTVSGGLLQNKLYDDGSAAHGDVKANDGIYSTILIFASGATTPVLFKYGAVFANVDTLNAGASYLDNEAISGQNHYIYLNLNGGSAVVSNKFGDQTTGVVEQHGSTLPVKYALNQNYPNPFNPSTKISYAIPVSGNVSLKIFNILGQEVATVFQGFQKAGAYIADFNASKLASGIYLYRLQAGQFSVAKKMILMK
jgi:hypothetical protein